MFSRLFGKPKKAYRGDKPMRYRQACKALGTGDEKIGRELIISLATYAERHPKHASKIFDTFRKNWQRVKEAEGIEDS